MSRKKPLTKPQVAINDLRKVYSQNKKLKSIKYKSVLLLFVTVYNPSIFTTLPVVFNFARMESLQSSKEI